MEHPFELIIDEETRLAWGLPLDDVQPDAIPVDRSGFDEASWFVWLEKELTGNAAGIPVSDPMTASDPITARIDLTVSLRQKMSALQAQEMRQLAALAEEVRAGRSPWYGHDPDIAFRSMISDLAIAHRVADRTMTRRLSEAEVLVNDFAETVAALENGSIDLGHARVIVEHGQIIGEPAARGAYEQLALERAATVTPGRLRRFAQLTAARVGEVSFQERYDRANAERRVWITELDNGMSEIGAILPTLLAEGIWDRLTEQAKAISHSGDPRTFDQLRTDLVAELLLTGDPCGDPDAPHRAGVGIRAEVAIEIPMLTFLDTVPGPSGAGPASIAGKGPIDPDTARRLAGSATRLVRILTHPVTGLTLASDTYRPSEKLRRFLRMRDGRCRFPSCHRSAHRCDIDHTVAWEHGGSTTPDNLAHLCRNHHTLKHHGGWGVKRVASGTLEWTSPTGIISTDVPDARESDTREWNTQRTSPHFVETTANATANATCSVA